MKNLSRNQSIAVFVSIAIVAYLLFGGPLANFFNPGDITNIPNNQMTQESGFTSQDLVVGTGNVAGPGNTLTVHYVGTLSDGRVFDSSLDRGTPFSFTLGVGQVIRGWDEGMAGMRVGGKRVLTIYPDYGYGANSVGSIPPNSVLNFEVELLGVE